MTWLLYHGPVVIPLDFSSCRLYNIHDSMHLQGSIRARGNRASDSIEEVSRGMYDLLVVGAGLYGAVMAREAADAGMRVLVIEKRDQVGGNIRTEQV